MYIITDIKGSTTFGRRISDGKTICRGSSRVKRLNGRNDKDKEEEKTEVLKRGESQVPPSFSLSDKTTINNVEIEDQESTDNIVRHVEDSNQEVNPPIRRSTRKRISVFEKQLRDYSR